MSILDKFRKQVATPLQPQVGTPFQTAALTVCALCVYGADNPREIVLRQKGDGQWLLWEQYLMVSIRQSKSEDPWA